MLHNRRFAQPTKLALRNPHCEAIYVSLDGNSLSSEGGVLKSRLTESPNLDYIVAGWKSCEQEPTVLVQDRIKTFPVRFRDADGEMRWQNPCSRPHFATHAECRDHAKDDFYPCARVSYQLRRIHRRGKFLGWATTFLAPWRGRRCLSSRRSRDRITTCWCRCKTEVPLIVSNRSDSRRSDQAVTPPRTDDRSGNRASVLSNYNAR